jgi:hypothetical protein
VKEEEWLLLLAFVLYFGLLAFWYGKLLEGKRLLKGKELLKRD